MDGRLEVAEGGRRPTIRDVAERAGVSKSLVSLVLRGSPKVSPERRHAVLQAAEELGYRPNAVARSLVLQRTNLVGLVISDIRNPFFAEVSDAVQAAAEEAGLRALVGSSGRDAGREADLADALVELRAEGVILMGPVLDVEAMRRVARAVPTVVVGRHEAAGAGIDTVVSDDARGAALAVAHLTDLGHERIAHITGGPGAGAPQRRAGYEGAMAAHGLPPRCVDGVFTEASGYDGTRRLLADGEPPTAVLAANDLQALGVLEALGEAGLTVPGAVSLVGYDNTHLAELRQFDLTSVDQPRTELGRLAMAVLLERSAGGRHPPRREVVRPRLVVRGSTGPPAGRPILTSG